MIRNNLVTFDPVRLLDDFIGFDDFFRDMEQSISSKSQTFPPYDIYTEDVKIYSEEGNEASCVTENHTFIKFALAGIPKEDVRVKFNNNILNVYNEKDPNMKEILPNNRKNIRLGIAQRNFSVTKTISKDLELVKCKMEDGCLIIEFRNIDQVEKGVEFIEIL